MPEYLTGLVVPVRELERQLLTSHKREEEGRRWGRVADCSEGLVLRAGVSLEGGDRFGEIGYEQFRAVKRKQCRLNQPTRE
ncbi:hypothetical protein Pmani_036934 [Petrolisthes manimaculis]|uniref:Uncharacterized protein n=1 Tax=Petrolisthes manimaculis TaxID=1843537 RepID=A0AAE1NJ75_9EUCA|nr:hypothetical protein Pmani_036934 [Petrolisthes manimaculis]